MASSNDSIYVSIIANTENAIKNLGKFIAGIVSVTAAMALLKKAVQFSVEQFLQQERADARLVAALRITGQQSARTVASIKELASSLQSVTGFADDATEEAAGLLIQLGGLTEQGVKKAIPLVQDLASLMGMDLVQAAELVGKTLGSDTNALSRYGINIAQNLGPNEKFAAIMGELEKKAGGFAKEIHDMTVGGTLEDFKNAIGDLAENSGALITRIFLPVAEWLTEQMNKITQWATERMDLSAIYEKYKSWQKGGKEELNPYEWNKLASHYLPEYEKALSEEKRKMASARQLTKEDEASFKYNIHNLQAEVDRWKWYLTNSAKDIAALETTISGPDILSGYAADGVGTKTKEEIIADRLKAASEWISDDQKAYNQDLENGAVSMDTYNASMYILEQRAFAAAEAQDKLNAAVKKMTDLMEAETAVANPSWANEDQEAMALAIADAAIRTADAAERAADEAKKIEDTKVKEAWEGLADEFQKIAEAMASEAIVTFFTSMGEVAAGTKTMAEAMSEMVAQLASSVGQMMVSAGLQLIIANAYNPALVAVGLGLIAAGGVAIMAGSYASANVGGGAGVMPRMAAGGIVTRPTLALIGESGPEAVVPLGRGGGGGTTIIVQGSIWQTEDLARAVADRMGRW